MQRVFDGCSDINLDLGGGSSQEEAAGKDASTNDKEDTVATTNAALPVVPLRPRE